MSDPFPYVTVDVDKGLVVVHDADHLGDRLRCSGFRQYGGREWEHRYRNEGELLPLLAWLISQRLPFRDDIALKPKHLDMLKPCLVVHFEPDGDGMRPVVEEYA